jgi:hypothetical protein
MLLIVRDSVAITSVGLGFLVVRGVKMAANASFVIGTGKLFVREMGRWREKKSEADMSTKPLTENHQTQFRATYGGELYAVYWAH